MDGAPGALIEAENHPRLTREPSKRRSKYFKIAVSACVQRS
jgi:hypothetical protein